MTRLRAAFAAVLPVMLGPGCRGPVPPGPSSLDAKALSVLDALRDEGRRHGGTRSPVLSPADELLVSRTLDTAIIQGAGYPVVPWTVDNPERMTALLGLRVAGIISDRPDLLRVAIERFDADGDGEPGDYMTPGGLIDERRIDAQGHRGARDLRPENTLPAFEAALDESMTTLELDVGATQDRRVLVSHDVNLAPRCRTPGAASDVAVNDVAAATTEWLIASSSLADIRAQVVCDRPDRGGVQRNDLADSPVSRAFALAHPGELPDPYTPPELVQVFAFADYYAGYYTEGLGRTHPNAARRTQSAARVRFSVEIKATEATEAAHRTLARADLAALTCTEVERAGLAARVDIQSFDVPTLLSVERSHPALRAVYLLAPPNDPRPRPRRTNAASPSRPTSQ